MAGAMALETSPNAGLFRSSNADSQIAGKKEQIMSNTRSWNEQHVPLAYEIVSKTTAKRSDAFRTDFETTMSTGRSCDEGITTDSLSTMVGAVGAKGTLD